MKRILIATTFLLPFAASAQVAQPSAPSNISRGAVPQNAQAPTGGLPTTSGSQLAAPGDTGAPVGTNTPLPQTPAPFAPGLNAPSPDSTTSGPLSNRPRSDATPYAPQMQPPMDQLPESLPSQTMQVPMERPAQRKPAAQPAAQTGNDVSGTAAKLGEAELDRLLQSPAGPPLPDADMGAHAGEGHEEEELNRRLRVWQMRNKIGDQIVTAATNLQRYKKIVDGRPEGEANPQQVRNPLQPGTTPVMQQQQQQTAGDPSTPRTRTVALPVVTRVSGLGSRVTATVLIPYDGAKTLRVGDRLPNGMQVKSIENVNVVVELRDGSRRTLPWGDSVPAYEDTAVTQRAPQQVPLIAPTPQQPTNVFNR